MSIADGVGKGVGASEAPRWCIAEVLIFRTIREGAVSRLRKGGHRKRVSLDIGVVGKDEDHTRAIFRYGR